MLRDSIVRRGRSLFTLFDRLFAFERSFGDTKAARQARPNLTTLEDRIVPDGRPAPLPTVLVSSGPGMTTQLRSFDMDTGKTNFTLSPYGEFKGGGSVASADFNFDTIPDAVISAGPGGGPRVRLIDGKTGLGMENSPISDFWAYNQNFTHGVEVAAGDVNGDGYMDIITVPGPGGGPRVRAFSGFDGEVLADFFAYNETFMGGLHVASGDFNIDNKDEIVIGAGAGGGPRISVFKSNGEMLPNRLGDFFAFDEEDRSGVYLAISDVNGDTLKDIIVGSGAGHPSTVRVFNGRSGTLMSDRPVFGNGSTAAVRVASAYVNQDAFGDVIVAGGPGTTGSIKVFAGGTNYLSGSLLDNFTPFSLVEGGVMIAGANDPGSDPVEVSTPTIDPGLTLVSGQQFSVSVSVGHPNLSMNPEPTGLVNFYAQEYGDKYAQLIPLGQGTLDGSLPSMTTILVRDVNLPENINYYDIVADYQGDTYWAAGVSRLGTPLVITTPNDKPISVPPDAASCAPGSAQITSASGTGTNTTLMPYGDGGIRLSDGSIFIERNDFDSAGFGTPWSQNWIWTNARGIANGWAGVNTRTTPIPQLIQVNGLNSLAVVQNAQSHFFDLIGSEYVARFAEDFRLNYDIGGDQYIFSDSRGNKFIFDGIFGTPGLLEKYVDAAGNEISVTWNGDDLPEEITRTETIDEVTYLETWAFEYIDGGDNDELLESVTLSRQIDAEDPEIVRKATYTYYEDTEVDEVNGLPGDLKYARISEFVFNGISFDEVELETSYYRYYVDSEGDGFEHGLQMAFGPAAFERLTKFADDEEDTVDELTDVEAKVFADHYLEYDEAERVAVHAVAGDGCSACAGGQGTYSYAYDDYTNSTDVIGGANVWRYKTTETLPDSSLNVAFLNGSSQVMLFGRNNADELYWNFQYQEFNERGQVITSAMPSALSLTSPSDAHEFYDLLNDQGGNYEQFNDDAGLVGTMTYADSTTATDSTPGDVLGYLTGTSIQNGESGGFETDPQTATTYILRAAYGQDFFFPAESTRYRTIEGADSQTTTYDYTWHTIPGPIETAEVESVEVTLPTVTTGQNGPNSATQSKTEFNIFGWPIEMTDAASVVSTVDYDVMTGAPTKQGVDVNTLNLVTSYTVDTLGRETSATHPNGRVDHTVYNDANHEVRHYPAWQIPTSPPPGPPPAPHTTGPITVIREDRYNSYREVLTMAVAAPDVDGDDKPAGTESISIGNVQSLSRQNLNEVGQVISSHSYFTFDGMSYSKDAGIGTIDVNYYETQNSYGFQQGRRNKVVSPAGTINRTVFDSLGRPISEWVGTNDTPASGPWAPDNNDGDSNMIQVAEYEYDNGGPGDGNLTQITQIPGGGADDRISKNYYDWRNRSVLSLSGMGESKGGPTFLAGTYVDYDNLNQVVSVRRFAPGTYNPSEPSYGDLTIPAPGGLRAKTTYIFDELGRVFQSKTFSVNPSSGSVSSDALTTNTWFDARGQVIKISQPGGLVQKMQYDGAGRLSKTFMTDGGGDSDYTYASHVAGDHVLEQMENVYDVNSNLIKTITKQRNHDETTTGELGDYNSAPFARVSYMGFYFDAADRQTSTVNVGTNTIVGTPTEWSRPGSAPSGSATALRTDNSYDDAGLLFEVTDPRGLISETYYDKMSRTIKTIENVPPPPPPGPPPPPSSDENKTTEYTYGPAGMTSLKAHNDADNDQITQWVYGVTVGTGSTIYSNDIVSQTWWPNEDDGTADENEKDLVTVNALDQTLTSLDRNDTEHTFTYDVLSRLTSDAVNPGAGVDDAILRIETAYDTQGNAFKFTSYNAASSGSIVNEVLREFNGLGQLTTEYQVHDGAVTTGTSTTLRVGYSYSEMAGSANHSRLTSITYPYATSPTSPPPPAARVLTNNYESGLNNNISRLTSLSDGGGTLETYSYLGLGTVVERSHPLPPLSPPPPGPPPPPRSFDLTYVGSPPGDGGDQYAGLDRFGRIVDQNWVMDDGSPASLDQFQYAYDENSNRLTRVNTTDGMLDFDESYTYDGLNQIESFTRDTHTQAWEFDSLGNWESLTTDGGDPKTRTHNAQNEILSVEDQTSPDYDENGNMIVDETGKKFIYDAWNRLVLVTDDEDTPLVAYEHDALYRKIEETSASTVDLYYSDNWQVLEERDEAREDFDTIQQYVWSPVYIDAMVLRDRYDDEANNVSDERLWVAQDANYNVTALMDTTGFVVERLSFTPFGLATVHEDDYDMKGGGSDFAWNYTYQGARWNDKSNFYDLRFRSLTSSLGRWTINDPIQYDSGDSNLFMFVRNNPVIFVDPNGQTLKCAILAFAGGAGGAVGTAAAIGTLAPALVATGPFVLIPIGIGAADGAYDTYKACMAGLWGPNTGLPTIGQVWDAFADSVTETVEAIWDWLP